VSSDSSVKLDPMTLGQVLANSAEEDEVYPLTIPEIAKEQHKDRSIKRYFTQGGKRYEVKLLKDTEVLVDKQGNIQQWYHHYLQHVKTCPTCQKNKRRSLKYVKLPTKIVVSKPWKALCVDRLTLCV